MIIDQAADTLNRLGWTVGTYNVITEDQVILCVVEIEQGDNLIRVMAECTALAWEVALQVTPYASD
jgi:hypothetical protein